MFKLMGFFPPEEFWYILTLILCGLVFISWLLKPLYLNRNLDDLDLLQEYKML